MERVRAASYPELAGKDIRVRPLQSESDYLQARFDAARFLLGRRMRYVILVNPGLNSQGAPEPGVNAIVAHELAHIAYYAKGRRVRLLGLIRLLSPAWRARFERATDKEAIRRGYAPGLKEYRRWLYTHVPAGKLKAKLRDYLSPDEIDAAVKRP